MQASLLLHAAVITGVWATGISFPPSRAPLSIDLTIGGPWSSEVSATPASTGRSRPAGKSGRQEPPSPARDAPAPPAPVSATGPEPLPDHPKETTPAAAIPASPDRQTEAAATRKSGSAGDIGRDAASPGGGAGSNVPSPATPAGAGFPHGAFPGASTARAATGTGADAETHAEARGLYLQGNYAYIRDAIQQGIAYPAVARKMGWEGKVVVAFLVLSDGSVRDVRVVQGSGHPALDRGAVEAVRKAAPFPRPPAEAEVITPVVYRLD
jgi:protein TonB